MKIMGIPVPKARPKFQSKGQGGRPLMRLNKKTGKMEPFVLTYDPQAKLQEELKLYTRWTLRKFHPGFKIFKGPIKVVMSFYMPILRSWPKFKKKVVIDNLDTYYHDKQPDGTNLFKFPEDCFNGILWNDDGQVAEFRGRKIYSDTPETHIYIEELPQPDWEFWKRNLTKKKGK